MQEIKKRRILLASVLKPVDEPRMFERMGQSLARNGCEVFISGFPPSSAAVDGIHFLPHSKFKRISLGRIKVRFKILRNAFVVKPDVFIVSTHELLGVALLYRIFTAKRIIYDVQENYWQNIVFTNAFPKVLRLPIACLVRFKEIITSVFFSKFLLAERSYAVELGFTKGKAIVVENKCKLPAGFERKVSNDSIQLLFTGTIAESSGIFHAIDLAKQLHAVEPKIKLTIIGQCSQEKIIQRIEREIAENSFITLVGGKDFVSHNTIMNAIATAHFGIISYPTSPHTENKVPTKLYEYLSCQLPLILQNKNWAAICEPYKASISIDFTNPDISLILQKIQGEHFYIAETTEANWQSEEPKFIRSIISVNP